MLRRSTRSSKKSPSPSKDLENKSVKRSRSTQKQEKSNKSLKKGKSNIITEDSSSESDIEDYLQPIDKIDLNSSFFDTEKSKNVPSFDNIEKQIFSGVTVTRLSDSDTSSEDEHERGPFQTTQPISVETVRNQEVDDIKIKESLKEEEKVARLNFLKLQDYTRKIEEAKRSVEEYNARKAQEKSMEETKTTESINVQDLLAAGEGKLSGNDSEINQSGVSMHSSSFETHGDSDEEDWEEIKEKQENEQKDVKPQKDLEITVELPTTMKKKKGDDLLLAVKRRLNRMKKENQLLIHKVHLLCWIAHGNYVNSVINDQGMMALGLSLIPSERCYPSGRIDLSYLEQILKWYRRTITHCERLPPKNKSLIDLLTEQMDQKQAYTKKMLVLIFIIVLRSLGIQCRLVLSFQVEPLRPPSSDLHFLGNSSDSKKGESSKSSKIIDVKNENIKKSLSASNIKEMPTKTGDNINQRITKGKLLSQKKEPSQNSTKKLEHSKVDTKNSKSSGSSRSSKNVGASNNKKENSKSRNENENLILKSEVKENNSESKVKSSIKDKEDSHSNEKKKSESKKQTDTEKRSRIGSRTKKSNDNSSTAGNSKNVEVNVKHVDKDDSNQLGRPKSLVVNIDMLNEHCSKASSDKLVKESNKGSENHRSMKNDSNSIRRSKSLVVNLDRKETTGRSKRLMVNVAKLDVNHSKIRSKSTSDKPDEEIKKKMKIPQLDGSDNSLEDFKGFKQESQNRLLDGCSFEDFYSRMYNKVSQVETLKIPQLDGTRDEPSVSKPNLAKLKNSNSVNKENCKSERHKRAAKKPNYLDRSTSDSDDCFEESPKKKVKNDPKTQSESSKPKRSVNLNKLRDVKHGKNESPGKSLDVTKDIMQLIKDRIAEQKRLDKSRMVKKKRSAKHDSDSEYSDYVPEPIKKKYHSDSEDDFSPKMKVKQRVQVKKKADTIKKLKKPKDPSSRKVISSDSEYTEEEKDKPKTKTAKKRGNDAWLEVFLETEEKWISVDVIFGKVHCVNELYSRATHPVSYVVAWNNDNSLKDITKRYCQNYNTATRKLRIDAQWWEQSLKPFVGRKNARDKEEDDEFERQQLEKPLPTSIAEYKNHPLYALERHLLKFEVIYPPNAPPLGFVRNEPVYSRECVHVCHSREIWLKQAKVVKLGQKPYKIVKARPKYDRLSNKMITDQTLEIFGPWQVEDYDPPAAENGVVPRNAFGNVDLFKPSMLPKKCVHLQLPGLNKVAKRMNIDCASAIIGFDFHCGWSHPIYDGFVVCEEFEDELVAAWNIEQEETERREQEKYEKRVYGNWKKLIKGLMIRERLKAKYGFGEENPESSNSGVKKKKVKGPTFCTKKRRIMSDSSEDEDRK